LGSGKTDGAVLAGKQKASFCRPFREELRGLEEGFAAGKFDRLSDSYKRLEDLRYRVGWEDRRGDTIHNLLMERDAIADLYPSDAAGRGEMKGQEKEWNDKIDRLNKNLQQEFKLTRDNLHIIRQDQPVMSWDRRELEPLVVQPTEFFPNMPCCLLDIQPRAMHPLLRDMGPQSSRSGDIFELILGGLLQASMIPISKALETVYTGAAEGILPYCPSLWDRSQGGMPLRGFGELTPRVLNERQLIEILDGWMKWPFAPTYPELVGRASEDAGEGAVEDDGSGVAPVDFL
jgi:transcription factor 1